MSYFILSLDGGGIRGVLTARLLERLAERSPFLDDVDLVAGTSTGGILALGLARGLAPKELVALYVKKGDKIFSDRDIRDKLLGPADELLRADYDNKKKTGLYKALEETLGDRKLEDLGKKVLIPTFDLDNQATPPETRTWKPKFLHNFDTPGNDGKVLARDAALRTSAAPTYFPSYQGFVDGGVVANNPSACALAKAIKAGQALADIRLLSIGTGSSPHVIRGDRLDWGKTKWALKIIELMFEGVPGVADYQCQQLLGDRYRRLNVPFDQPIGLDDVARIDVLLAKADQADISETLSWLANAANEND